MDKERSITLAALVGLLASTAAADEVPPPETLEAKQYVIGEVTLDKADIFDLSNPDENTWLYRGANRWHIMTRDKTITKQLLFGPGDLYNQRLIEESERLLRQNKYLFDARITATQAADGRVDLTVSTRDVWSLWPELSLSRGGGENKTVIGLEEDNLLGRGQRVRIVHEKDVDREENIVEFSDQHFGRSWVSLLARYADKSDGNTSLLSVVRPFYALDTRWAAGGTVYADDRQDKLYQYGEAAAEYRHERDYAVAFGGWSSGLTSGKARRWTAGIVHDENRFSPPVNGSLPVLLPEDRKLIYPLLGFEIVEDGYTTTHNQEQMERTEDFQMGLQFSASLGWADKAFGSDRDATIFSARASRGYGQLDKTALLLSAETSGRMESGALVNSLLSVNVRYYHRQSEKRTFYASLHGTLGESLDLDNLVKLGGDTGLRGYPLRYQVGESMALATIEQRYYTDWYPFRLFRVGGAIFADVGRVWGDNPVGPDNRGWDADVGIGLRLSPTRITSKVVHIDLAFPLNSDESIDSVQLLVEAKKSF